MITGRYLFSHQGVYALVDSKNKRAADEVIDRFRDNSTEMSDIHCIEMPPVNTIEELHSMVCGVIDVIEAHGVSAVPGMTQVAYMYAS